MRVVMDGSFLRLPPSGTGAYVRCLVSALRDAEPALDLRLISPLWEALDHLQGKEPRSLTARLRKDRRIRRAGWELRGVARAARALRPDLLHVPHLSAPVRAPCPLVVTIHDVIPFVLPAYRASPWMRLHLAVVRRTVHAAQRVMTPSQASAAAIARVLQVPMDRIRITPEAAGPCFKPATDLGSVREAVRRLGVTDRYVFNVGGFDVRKNLPVLVEAFARVRARLPESVQLVIAGAPHTTNPRVFPPLAPLVQRLGLTGAVILPGRVSEDEKLALYQGADLYVTPSLFEGFGLTALEAMACGVPTIAANRTSLPEVVGDGGLLVEPEPEALAAAMLAVLGDAALAAALRARGRARAAMFSWERTARQTLDVYREAIECARGGAGNERIA